MDYFPVILIFIPFESKFFKTKIKTFSHRFCLSILFIFKNFICFVVLIYSPLSHTKTSKTIPFFKIDFPFYVTPPPPHTLPYNLFCVCFMSFYSLCFYSHLSSLFIFRYDFIRPSNCYNFFDTLVF